MMKAVGIGFIATGLGIMALSALLLITGCADLMIAKHVVVDGARNGNGGIGNKAACPAVQERRGNLIIFRDVEGDGC